MDSAQQNSVSVIDRASQTIEVDKKVSRKSEKKMFYDIMNIEKKYYDSIDTCAEVLTKYLLGEYNYGNQKFVTNYFEHFVKRCLSHDEKSKLLEKMNMKEEVAQGNIASLERKLQNAKQQKQMKQKELEDLSKKYLNSEIRVAHLTNVNEVLKDEKSKRSVEDAAYEKLKKDYETIKDETNRLEETLTTETDTMKKLVLENEKLQEQVGLKIEEVSELRKERNSMMQAFEKDGERSADHQLLLKKLELSDLMEKFTNPSTRAKKESLFESIMSSPEVSNNAKKSAKKQFDDHFEANAAAVKVIQKNLEMINKHFQFTVNSLLSIPDIPPAFNEEVKCLMSEKLDDCEEKCGVCSKPLRTSSNSEVVVSAMSQLQCHFECATKDRQQ